MARSKILVVDSEPEIINTLSSILGARNYSVSVASTGAEGMEMAMPGDNVAMKIKLIYPVALEVGLRFAIREGGRTVGAGSFTRIIE